MLLLVQFMVVLDIAIVNVALPSIQTDLGFSQENLQWVISAYALLFGGFLLLGGRAADLLGRRRLFLTGIVLFTTSLRSSLGFAWSEGALIGARAFQGSAPRSSRLPRCRSSRRPSPRASERNKALGAWGAVGAFGAVAGVLLGGILTDLLSWEWIFFVNVPVGVPGFVLTPFLIGESRDATAESYDVPGAVLVTSGLVALVYAITQANDYGWGSIETIGLFTAPRVLLGGFLGWEARAKDPLMPFSIFRPADARRREHRRADPRDRHVRDVPDAHALHAAGARLFADEDRHRLPGRGRNGDRLVRRRGAARDADRRQAGARRRDDGADRRARVLHPGLGRRLLPRPTSYPASC